jgi:hypothetical protein
MVYFVNVNVHCEFHHIQSSFGDVVEGNLHNELVILVM